MIRTKSIESGTESKNYVNQGKPAADHVKLLRRRYLLYVGANPLPSFQVVPAKCDF